MITTNTLQRVEILIRMQRTITENVIGRSFSLRDYARQLRVSVQQTVMDSQKKNNLHTNDYYSRA
jgi:DNA integrity scanning protein DisA with diadenylate cyclase activity